MNQPKGVFDFLRARGEEFFTQISDELMSNPQFLRAMQAAWKGKERIDDAVSQALRSMNVPTRAEFKKVMARVEALERELGDQRQGMDVLQAEVKKLVNERAAGAAGAPGGAGGRGGPGATEAARAKSSRAAARAAGAAAARSTLKNAAARSRAGARASTKRGGTPPAE